jgi:hypothetical protein
MVADEIRVQLQKYLSGAMSLDEFEDWFLPSHWEDDSPMAHQIRLRLMEHDRGDLNCEEVARFLFQLIGEDFVFTRSDSGNNEVMERSRVLVGPA